MKNRNLNNSDDWKTPEWFYNELDKKYNLGQKHWVVFDNRTKYIIPYVFVENCDSNIDDVLGLIEQEVEKIKIRKNASYSTMRQKSYEVYQNIKKLIKIKSCKVDFSWLDKNSELSTSINVGNCNMQYELIEWMNIEENTAEKEKN